MGKCYIALLAFFLFSSVFSGNRKVRVSSWFCASKRMYLTPTDGKKTRDISALYLRTFPFCSPQLEVPFEKEAHPGLQEMLAKSIRAFTPLRLAAGESPSQASPISSRSLLWSKMTKRGTKRESPQREINHCKTLLSCYTHQVRRGPISGKGRVKTQHCRLCG